MLNIRLFFLIFTSLVLCFCTGRQTDKKENPVSKTDFRINPDSTYLFDGKTLEGWEITNFGPQGPVYVSGGEIILGMGDGCTGITWTKEFPETNYRVTLEAKRIAGNDFFCGMTFPVGKDPCSLIVGGWGGTVVGLSSINKMDASENETTSMKRFEKDHWYRICLIVKEDTIKAYIDDAEVVDFVKGDKTLSIRPEVELSKPFGIASWYTTAALRNIRLEKIL
ncbi:MAG: hypothetical protein A2V64_01990 [Bacteroidetes bacterium RBG_13_43_22]|nr:MAG: hypothetical protein A2V64_01990 [Bacteroidetes bacterium RBG_13_43_22]